jgi:hypothetical protein
MDKLEAAGGACFTAFGPTLGVNSSFNTCCFSRHCGKADVVKKERKERKKERKKEEY